MRIGKKKNYGKKAISHRTSFSSLTISKKNTCIKHTGKKVIPVICIIKRNLMV